MTRLGTLLCAVLLLGCQSESTNIDEPISAYRDRMLVRHQEEAAADAENDRPRDPLARPVAWQSQLPARAALIAQPATTTQPAPRDVLAQMPDPVDAPRVFEQRLQILRDELEVQRRRDPAHEPDDRVLRSYERVVKRANENLEKISRPDQVQLSLAECIQRALENNYAIRSEAHNPAISQTWIVEKEAAFDVEFYLDTSWTDQDQASLMSFTAGTSDSRSYEGGFRKLLPTGMMTSVSLGQQRSQNSLPAEYQFLNPAYSTSFVAQLQQPLLRGFGLDVNRSQINISKIDYQISYETFIQKVRDTLLEVETAYWQLAQARRAAAILAVSVAQNRVTFNNMEERLTHDATQVEVANSKSRYLTAYVNYLEAVKVIRDAEDRLKNLLNDPALKLSDMVEIVPAEVPIVAPTAFDHFAAVRTALDRRSEIRAAKQQIDATRINTNLAKNAILPKLDVLFRYEVQGLGPSADSSFDKLTTNRFISYTLGANFSYNFGERAARAQLRRAHLQESQAIVGLNQVTDTIVEQINQTIRTLTVRWDQVPPSLTSVEAAARNLRSLQARTQRIDPNYLQTELGAVEQLANTRSMLLQVIMEYNVGLVQLEAAKGTLLEYNNVVVTDAQSGR
ncbi:MAG: TolC family protein [Phycisphaerae bacterium]|nr:TolC family protein [Phycisphaerae bacterium]